MEKPPQFFDVCIVCALPEEARAFLKVVRPQCEGAREAHISPRYRYSYRFATIKNNKGETLNLHLSWLPRYGPEEMTLHLTHILEECQPRIAIMTGICAGDAQRVQLGDLVVAERTFTYDNGKFTLDEQGRSVHLHDTMTYQPDANILQFLGLFDDWKPLVARLKRPSSSPERSKRHKIVRHIKAMASGSAVRADHPFEDVRASVQGTAAIDMEGAAFGRVMSHHPLIPWLVVKGVCDYADRDKNDAYHDYAARASALYALSFIQHYVTNTTMLRRDEHQSQSQGLGIYLHQEAHLGPYGSRGPNPTLLTFYIYNNVEAPPTYVSHIGLEATIDGEPRTVICEISPRFFPDNPHLKEEGPLEPGRGRTYLVDAPGLSAQLQAYGENIVLKEAYVEDENRNRYSSAISHDLAMWLLSFPRAKEKRYRDFL